MEALVIKLGSKLPQLLARAAAGDAIAIGLLAALGVAAVASAVKKR